MKGVSALFKFVLRVISIVLVNTLLLTIPVLTHAQEEVLPFLPDTSVVKDNLLNSPGIASALAKREAQRERAKGIQAGHAEFTVRSNIQSRRAGY